MASLAPQQDLIMKVGLAMDYAGTEATAMAIEQQAEAYRALAEDMLRAASGIRESVRQHRADVAAAELAAEEAVCTTCGCPSDSLGCVRLPDGSAGHTFNDGCMPAEGATE